MPTDYACQSAAELAAQSVGPIRDFMAGGHLGQGPRDVVVGQSAGAACLLVFLDGLHAELVGALTGWHVAVGSRIARALGVPAAAGQDRAPAPQQSGWEALGLVQRRAQEVLTTLAARPRDLIRPGELASRVELVEDAFAGALRRIGVPVEASVQCAGDLAAAAGSLFGLRSAPPARTPEPPHASAPARAAAPAAPAPVPDWTP